MLLSIIGIIIEWFIIGFIINFLVYGGKPNSEMGKSETVKSLHIILNVITVIFLIAVLFK